MLQQRLGITTIVVTHDQREAMTMADQIVVMSDGRVEQKGAPKEIYHQPANAFVADFIGKTNFMEGTATQQGIRIGSHMLEVETRFVEGAPVQVAIRPERVCIDDEQGPNRVPAEVTFVRDLGPVREYHLSSDLGPIIVEYALGENVAELQVGDGTEVRLPPEALHLFPAKAAPKAMAAE